MTTTRIPDIQCPFCSSNLGEATGVNAPGAPATGDAAICFNCGGLLIVDMTTGTLLLNPATPADLAHFANNRAVKRVLEEIKKKGRTQ